MCLMAGTALPWRVSEFRMQCMGRSETKVIAVIRIIESRNSEQVIGCKETVICSATVLHFAGRGCSSGRCLPTWCAKHCPVLLIDYVVSICNYLQHALPE